MSVVLGATSLSGYGLDSLRGMSLQRHTKSTLAGFASGTGECVLNVCIHAGMCRHFKLTNNKRVSVGVCFTSLGVQEELDDV